MKCSVALRNSLIIVTFCLTPTIPLLGQSFVKQVNTVSLESGGALLPYGFFGGTYIPKLEFYDIDNDSDPDLFLVQTDGRITYYQNDGSSGIPHFVWTTDFYDSLSVNRWMRFADIDGDGDADILFSQPGARMGLYENTGTSQMPDFKLSTAIVNDTLGNPILTEDQTVPFFCDIDGDGDLDFFSGRSIGTLSFYENVGNSHTMRLVFVTDNFQNISIITPAKPSSANRHGASAVTFFDLDNDHDPDLFWGDFFSTGIYYLPNLGTAAVPLIPDTASSTFPSRILKTQGFNMPTFADIDQDGDGDLFVGVIYREEDRDNFWWFENTGTAAAPGFTLRTKNFISGLDVGRNANPVLIDLDQDGDRDLVIGSYDGKITYYKNISSGSDYRFKQDSLTLSVPSGQFLVAPAFGDLDHDGDWDAILGDFEGKLLYYENTGSVQAPNFVLQNSQFANIDVGNNSAPILKDIDHDGDLDLFVGEEDGTINYYQNTGTSAAPQFTPITTNYLNVSGLLDAVPEMIDYDKDGDLDIFVGYRNGYTSYYENQGNVNLPDFHLITEQFGGVKVTQNAVPRWFDLEGDGDLDLVMGNLKGGIEYYSAENQSPSLVAIPRQKARVDSLFILHVFATGNPFPHYKLAAAPSGMTIDSISGVIQWSPDAQDIGARQVLVEAQNNFGKDQKAFMVDVARSTTHEFFLYQNYPNPFNASTQIAFDLKSASRVKIMVYNILGQQIKTLFDGIGTAGRNEALWDGTNQKGYTVGSGVYFYQISVNGHFGIHKMLFIK